MDNMQFHLGSQIQNSMLSFVKSPQLLKLKITILQTACPGNEFKASGLNGMNQAFAGL